MPSPATAIAIHAEETAFELEAIRARRSEAAALETALRSSKAETDALAVQVADLRAIRARLAIRLDDQQAGTRAWTAARVAEAEAARNKVAAQLEFLERDLARAEQLAEAGSLAETRLESKRGEIRALRHELDRQDARTAALEAARDALRRGIGVGGEFTGSDYIRQRIDEIDIRVTDLEARRTTLEERTRALGQELRTVREDAAKRQSFAPEAGVSGVVWQASPGPGTPVTAGDTVLQVLDCEQRFIEVLLDERHFEQIRPGDAAEVVLKGSDRTFSARVDAIRGAGTSFAHPILVATPKEARSDQLTLRIGLAPARIEQPGVANAFCDVGRTAEVRIAREGGVVEEATDRLRALFEQADNAIATRFPNALAGIR